MRAKIRSRVRSSQPSLEATMWRIELVYYVRHMGHVKIGWTNNLPARLRRLGVPPTAVLAYEYGTRDLERQRHEQFAHLNVRGDGLGVEHFQDSPDLRTHTVGLMAEAMARVAEDAAS